MTIRAIAFHLVAPAPSPVVVNTLPSSLSSASYDSFAISAKRAHVDRCQLECLWRGARCSASISPSSSRDSGRLCLLSTTYSWSLISVPSAASAMRHDCSPHRPRSEPATTAWSIVAVPSRRLPSAAVAHRVLENSPFRVVVATKWAPAPLRTGCLPCRPPPACRAHHPLCRAVEFQNT